MAHERGLKWSHRALVGLDGIAARISKDNPKASRDLIANILSQAENLKNFPLLGRPLTQNLRELVVHKNYLLTYRVTPLHVEILQVWHVARRH